MKINEIFDFGSGTYTTDKGTKYKIIYIDPKTSEAFIPYKDVLKNKFGASWIKVVNSFGWFVKGNQEEYIEKYIKPCIQYMFGVEKNPQNVLRSIDDEVLKIISTIESDINAAKNSNFPVDPIFKEKAEKFIEEMMTKLDLSSPELQDFITKYAAFRKQMRFFDCKEYKGLNALIIMFTRPDATEVRPKKQWEEMGYTIKPNAKAIGPLEGINHESRAFSKSEREAEIEKFCKKHDVKNVSELAGTALKYDLDRILQKGKLVFGGKETKFNFVVYDISDVIPGPNVKPRPKMPENTWYLNVDEDEKDKMLCNAIIEFGKTLEGGGLTFTTTKRTSGERGSSASNGVINILDDGKMKFPTLVHELTHSLRHWAFSSDKNPKLRKFYRPTLNDDLKEQEAELCAAFVSKQYKYPIQSEVNYVHSWNLTKENVKRIFDEIAYLADYIEKGIEQHLKK